MNFKFFNIFFAKSDITEAIGRKAEGTAMGVQEKSGAPQVGAPHP